MLAHQFTTISLTETMEAIAWTGPEDSLHQSIAGTSTWDPPMVQPETLLSSFPVH